MSWNDNNYESAFGKLMMMLLMGNHPLFEAIAENKKMIVFRGFEFSIENLTQCWSEWCMNNTQKYNGEDFKKREENELQ